MNNTDKIAWIFVRALGVYFASQAIIHFHSLVTYFSIMLTFFNILEEIPKPEVEERIIRTLYEVGFVGLIFFIFVFLAYYCLRKGDFFHKLLTYIKD